jgi:hypothetical protein
MTPELVFSIANTAALVSWVTLAVFPRRRVITDIICARVVPALFAALYVALLLTKGSEGEGGFGSLAGVAQLFSHPWILLAGWIHYLAFDLFVGSWEVRDARERSVRHLWVVPCLVLTFMFGPAGWLAYLGVRRWAAGS